MGARHMQTQTHTAHAEASCWFSISGPSSVGQSKYSRALFTALGVEKYCGQSNGLLIPVQGKPRPLPVSLPMTLVPGKNRVALLHPAMSGVTTYGSLGRCGKYGCRGVNGSLVSASRNNALPHTRTRTHARTHTHTCTHTHTRHGDFRQADADTDAEAQTKRTYQESELKPRAWKSSWIAVPIARVISFWSAVDDGTRNGQKFTEPNVGRSYWSRWHVDAYARTPDVAPEGGHDADCSAVTNTIKSTLGTPAPAGMMVQDPGI